MVTVERLDHVAIAVDDLEGAARLLRDALGLADRDPGTAGPDGPLMLGRGEASVALMRATQGRPAGLLHLAFAVDAASLEAAVRLLRGRGVAVRASDHGTSVSAYVATPLGFEIELTAPREDRDMAQGPAAVVTEMVARIFNAKELAAADELVAHDCLDHSGFPGQPPGREGMKARWAGMFAAFPDFRIEIEDLVVEGERVAMRSTGHGHHRGEFFGMPPTGAEVRFAEINISRVVDGRMVEHWAQRDVIGVVEQIRAALEAAAPAGA